MEEKKKPFWKKWAQRIGLALGLTASTLALGTSDVHANEVKVDDKNNVKVADTIDHSVTSEDALSKLEQLIAQNNQAVASKTTSDIDKVVGASNQVKDTANRNIRLCALYTKC